MNRYPRVDTEALSEDNTPLTTSNSRSIFCKIICKLLSFFARGEIAQGGKSRFPPAAPAQLAQHFIAGKQALTPAKVEMAGGNTLDFNQPYSLLSTMQYRNNDIKSYIISSTVLCVCLLITITLPNNFIWQDQARQALIDNYFHAFQYGMQLVHYECLHAKKQKQRPIHAIKIPSGEKVRVKKNCYPQPSIDVFHRISHIMPVVELKALSHIGNRITFTSANQRLTVRLQNQQVLYYLANSNCYFRYDLQGDKPDLLAPREDCGSAKVCIGAHCL